MGSTVFTSGDIDRPFFYRSAIKPFQAMATLRAGADPSRTNNSRSTCASHGGFPVHVALVEATPRRPWPHDRPSRLPTVDPVVLRCTRLLWDRRDVRTPQRRLHNCSGKHAGWLSGCASSGWDVGDVSPPRPSRCSDRSRDAIEEATQASVPHRSASMAAAHRPCEGTVSTVAQGFHTSHPRCRVLAHRTWR